MSELENLPFNLQSLHDAYRRGEKPEAVIRESHRRIAAIGDPGIFIHLLPLEIALADVGTLGPFDPKTKPLWGIPFVIKDNIDAGGAPTTAACPAYTYTADEDAFVVEQLRTAGAILIGKTNLDQFATGLVGVRTPYPVPKNALDPEIVPGGSSSGSAVAVSHGFATFGLGTDTAGSGRVPAALNNIVGLKPTLGMISNSGVVPACLTLDTVSIFALTVDDAYQVLEAAAAYDNADPYSRPILVSPLSDLPTAFRFGMPNADTLQFFGDDAQADSYQEAIKMLDAMGGTAVELDFTLFFRVAEMLYDGVWVAERYSVIADLMKRSPDVIHPATRRVIKEAEKFDAVDVFNSFYKLQGLKRAVSEALQGVDLLCVPTIPYFPTVNELVRDPIGPNSRMGTYTNFVNLLDLCGLAVPIGPRRDDRPGNVTLLGRAGLDHVLASLGAAMQSAAVPALGATDWPVPAPLVRGTAATTEEIEVAVVGAHMSGLPLNKDLTSRGARFLRAGHTSEHYRLFSLPGGPPARPGLIYTPQGASIDLEVWAMPKPQFGDFMITIPKPLGIGTIELDDGTVVKGFLCEQHAVADAEDITGYGGWRAYIEETSHPNKQLMERSNAQT